MFRKRFSVLLAAGLCMAWQNSLETLKLTREDFASRVTFYVTQELSDVEPGLALPTMGSSARPIFLALNDATRAAMVKELGGLAKAIVMTPAFEAAYNAKIKTANNAVNHGIVVKDTAGEFAKAANGGKTDGMEQKIQAMMRDQLRQMVVGFGKQVNSWDANTLKEMADGLKDQFSNIPPLNAKEKAQQAQGIAMLNEAQKLAPSNLAAAREKFRAGSLLGVYVEGGNSATASADEAKKEQQLNYDRRAMRPNLKAQLLAFVTQAKSVDFKAVTVAKGKDKVFSNPAYEKKSPMWKLIYRLGPGGAGAAIALAQGWAAEL